MEMPRTFSVGSIHACASAAVTNWGWRIAWMPSKGTTVTISTVAPGMPWASSGRTVSSLSVMSWPSRMKKGISSTTAATAARTYSIFA